MSPSQHRKTKAPWDRSAVRRVSNADLALRLLKIVDLNQKKPDNLLIELLSGSLIQVGSKSATFCLQEFTIRKNSLFFRQLNNCIKRGPVFKLLTRQVIVPVRQIANAANGLIKLHPICLLTVKISQSNSVFELAFKEKQIKLIEFRNPGEGLIGSAYFCYFVEFAIWSTLLMEPFCQGLNTNELF